MEGRYPHPSSKCHTMQCNAILFHAAVRFITTTPGIRPSCFVVLYNYFTILCHTTPRHTLPCPTTHAPSHAARTACKPCAGTGRPRVCWGGVWTHLHASGLHTCTIPTIPLICGPEPSSAPIATASRCSVRSASGERARRTSDSDGGGRWRRLGFCAARLRARTRVDQWDGSRSRNRSRVLRGT